MHLADWLEARGQTRAWLAAELGVSAMQVSRLLRGVQWMSGKMADRLVEVTGGDVTPNDVLDVWRRSHPPEAPQ